MTVRTQIANQIKSDNPSFSVKAYPAQAPDNLGAGRVHVSVYRDTLTPHELATTLTHALRIEIMVGGTAQPKAENDNDFALDQVLLSLQRISGVRFISATRTVFDDKYVGHLVSAECDSDNVYRNLVLEEEL